MMHGQQNIIFSKRELTEGKLKTDHTVPYNIIIIEELNY
jgi:hypothetical protein